MWVKSIDCLNHSSIEVEWDEQRKCSFAFLLVNLPGGHKRTEIFRTEMIGELAVYYATLKAKMPMCRKEDAEAEAIWEDYVASFNEPDFTIGDEISDRYSDEIDTAQVWQDDYAEADAIERLTKLGLKVIA
jgi:hypothetical protein